MKFTFIIPDMSWLYDYKAQFSLGILYLSSVLRECGCEDIGIYDTNIHSIDEIPHADVYGFSVVYNTYKDSVALAKAIRKKHPDSTIIVGGVHATLDSDNIDNVFDSVSRNFILIAKTAAKRSIIVRMERSKSTIYTPTGRFCLLIT